MTTKPPSYPSPPTHDENEVLRRMLSTPHKPHAEKPAPEKKQAPKKRGTKAP